MDKAIKDIANMLYMRDQFIVKYLKDYPVMTLQDYEDYISGKLKEALANEN